MKKFHYGSSLKLCLRWWRSKSDDGRLPRRIYQRQRDGRVAGGGEEGGHLPLVFPPLLPCECGIARGTGKAESVCRTACHATVLPISTGPPISHFRPLRLPLPPPPPPGSSHVPFYCCLPCPPRDPPTESLFISADDTTTGIHFNCSFRLQSFAALRFFLFCFFFPPALYTHWIIESLLSVVGRASSDTTRGRVKRSVRRNTISLSFHTQSSRLR